MLIMRSKFLSWVLLLFFLSANQGCDNKAYYYIEGATHKPETQTVLEPFVFVTQVKFSDGKKITVGVFIRRNNTEKHKEASVEFVCSDFEVFVEGKKLKLTRVMCPTGKELLELGQINADFATPNGRPKEITVSVPSIKVTTLDSPQKSNSVPKSSLIFTRRDYKRGFGLH